MAWYTTKSFLTRTGGHMGIWNRSHGQGDEVRVGGIYQCICCQVEFSAEAGVLFPGQGHHAHILTGGDVRWKLNVRANSEGSPFRIADIEV